MPCKSIVSSRFPPISLFEDVANPADLEAVYAVDLKTCLHDLRGLADASPALYARDCYAAGQLLSARLRGTDTEGLAYDSVQGFRRAMCGRVPITSAGKLKVKDSPVREGRNSSTGAAIEIPASRQPVSVNTPSLIYLVSH